MAIPRSVTRMVWSLATIGINEADDDSIRPQKAALTLAASIITRAVGHFLIASAIRVGANRTLACAGFVIGR